LVERRWNIAPPVLLDRLAAFEGPPDGLVLAPRRDGVWNNSIRYSRVGDERIVRVHPLDAEAAGVADGDRAEIVSAHGSVTAIVTVDQSVRAGVVSMSHGRQGQNPGRLTSLTEHVDPLTAMPQASGVAVTIRSGPITANR
jgi:anaerobic selenocysteine-containing dehydrogenase